MFTTPKKTRQSFGMRPRPYDSPIRGSPGGRLPTPLEFSRCPKTPNPRRLNTANSINTPSHQGHRVGVRNVRSPSPICRLSVTPRRRKRPLKAIIKETNSAIANSGAPIADEDKIYLKELTRLRKLGELQTFNQALAEARENVCRASEESMINNEIDEQLRESEVEAEAKYQSQIRRERPRQMSIERCAQRDRKEAGEGHQDELAEKKRWHVEDEDRPPAEGTRSRKLHSPPALTLAYEPRAMQTEQDRAARLDARRAAEVAHAHFAAQKEEEFRAQEEANLQARRNQAAEDEARRQADERVRAEMERSAEAEARWWAEEARMKAESKRMLAGADEETRKAEGVHVRAERQQEERLWEIQEEAQLSAQQKAQREAIRLRHEAELQADREAFAQRKEEMRRIAEQFETTFAERMERIADMQRMEETFESLVRARLEEIAFYANHPQNPLAEFYLRQVREAAQREAKAEQAKQSPSEDSHTGSANGSYQQSCASMREPSMDAFMREPSMDASMREPSMDAPMRELSMDDFMREPSVDASMYSIPDDAPYENEPPRTYAVDPPPHPPTDTERFAIWEEKWRAIDFMHDLSGVAFQDLPWPVLHDVESIDDITPEYISHFLEHPQLPSLLSAKKLISHYHPDKFRFRVLRKLHSTQQEGAREIADQCTILLLKLRCSNSAQT